MSNEKLKPTMRLRTSRQLVQEARLLIEQRGSWRIYDCMSGDHRTSIVRVPYLFLGLPQPPLCYWFLPMVGQELVCSPALAIADRTRILSDLLDITGDHHYRLWSRPLRPDEPLDEVVFERPAFALTDPLFQGSYIFTREGIVSKLKGG